MWRVGLENCEAAMTRHRKLQGGGGRTTMKGEESSFLAKWGTGKEKRKTFQTRPKWKEMLI
jgi:hypothetical protein